VPAVLLEDSVSSWPAIGFLVAVAGCGATGAAAWAIPAAAFSLTGMRIEAMSPVVDRYASAIGRVEAWGLFLGVAFSATPSCAQRPSWSAGRWRPWWCEMRLLHREGEPA
jgi:hypothetical protein